MATRHLVLKRRANGYWRTSWYDDRGGRHGRSFGRDRVAAQNEFAKFRADWIADERVRNPWMAEPLTIRGAWERYEAHARAYYRDADGVETGERQNIADAMEPVLQEFGETEARGFGPLALQQVRQGMIDADLAIGTINSRVHRIRRVWRWLASQELVPAGAYEALRTVASLAPGRCEARVTDPVGPVPEEHVWAAAAKMPASLAAMVRLQWWTAARPGEVCRIRPIDVDTTGAVWVYRPARHKTSWRGRSRIVLLGPRAQEALRPYLQRDVTACCFSPIEALRERFAACETHRHQPVAEPDGERRVGTAWTVKAYARAIIRACDEAGVPRWSPNQLRHNAATRLRKSFGLDVAQIVLGHATADVTQIYAELDMQRAIQVMESVG